MKNRNKKILITGILLSIFSICFITSYAFFNFTKETNEEIINTGTIYMKLDSEENDIILTNAFPETQASADLKTTNYIDFTVKGLNTYEDSIYYEIDVINGSIPTGYLEDNRMDPSNIMLELTDLDSNTIVSLIKYSELKNNRIYVKTIKSTTELEHKYRLRVWIDENTLISDTDSNKTYCASDECDDSTKKIYNELFASVKVQVYGDLVFKVAGNINVMGTLNSFSSYIESIKEVYFLNESQDLIDASYNAATIKYDITNTDKTIGTTELQNMDDYGKVLAWLEPIDETYYKLYIASDGYTYLSTGERLFKYYSEMEILDLINARTDFVINMSYMFERCSSLTSLDLSNFDTSNLTNMYLMFCECSSLTSLDLSNFNTSNVTNMGCMFYYCSKLTSLDISDFITNNVISIGGMFNHCSSLTSLDVSNFDTSNVTTMGAMFYNCNELTSLDLSNFNTSKVTSMSSMFESCSSLTSIDLISFDTSNVTNMSCMFMGCSNLTSLDVSNFDTSDVTDMSWMFESCSSLTSLDVRKFNTSKVTKMYSMFHSCSKLISLDLSKFNTINVINMNNMFSNCFNLIELDLSNFDTSKVTDMSFMFCNCSKIANLDVSSFNTSNVTDMTDMFHTCSSLTTIYIGNDWSTSSVTSSSYMFYNCTNLVGGAGTTYNSSYVDVTYAHVDEGTTNPGYLTLKS